HGSPPCRVCSANTPGAAAIAVMAAPVFRILRLVGSITASSLLLDRILLQLILHLGDTGLCAGFLLRLTTRRAAQADGADRLITDHDRNPAPERNDIGQTTLTGDVTFRGSFRPFGRRPPERQGRIGLAAGEFEIVGRRSIALEKYAQPARAIQNRD